MAGYIPPHAGSMFEPEDSRSKQRSLKKLAKQRAVTNEHRRSLAVRPSLRRRIWRYVRRGARGLRT